jgi:hypothetical protein
MQGRQKVLPSIPAKYPTEQGEQAVVLLLAEKEPGLQIEQDAELRV